MTKELWFERIFPEVYPGTRDRIIKFLQQKKVEIPAHPPIPDTAYLYQTIVGRRWQIRLSRTYLPTQFWHSSKGWVNEDTHAAAFDSELGAIAVMQSINI